MKDSWLNILQSEGKKSYFSKILDNLKKFSISHTIYPKQTDMFRAFEYFNIAETKVVILGQDPYHTEGVADGLSFSTRSDITPPSLKNIFEELKKDYPQAKIETNSLTSWAKQGVLLLNSVLTVNKGEAGSHKKIGWEIFTKKCLEEVVIKSQNAVFIVLGNDAKNIIYSLEKTPKNMIVLSHPSPLGAHHSFKNGKLFIKTNELLIKSGLNPINWDVIKE